MSGNEINLCKLMFSVMKGKLTVKFYCVLVAWIHNMKVTQYIGNLGVLFLSTNA